MVETVSSDMHSAVATFVDGPTAARAIAWLLNVGVRENQISQTAEATSSQAQLVGATGSNSRQRRKGFVNSLVDFMLPDDTRSRALTAGLPNEAPRRVTVTDIQAAMYNKILYILGDEGTVCLDAPKTDTGNACGMADASNIRGLIQACLIDSDSGKLLASEGGGKLNIDAIAIADTEFMRTWRQTVDQLHMDEPLEEILLTLDSQVHMFRPLEKQPSVLLHVTLDKATCNLALARIQVRNLEANLTV